MGVVLERAPMPPVASVRSTAEHATVLRRAFVIHCDTVTVYPLASSRQASETVRAGRTDSTTHEANETANNRSSG